MIRLFFEGDIGEVRDGLSLVEHDLGIEVAADGIPVRVQRVDAKECTLSVLTENGQGFIRYCDRPAFFRALTILTGHITDGRFEITENRRFDRNGLMVDCSRNAVVNPDTLKYIFRKMALMGLSWAMMYTEETYTLPDEPFFGYCRGRYTYEELKDLDDYAYALGIELIPCVQTLSHLNRFLHWDAADAYRDTKVTMMVGEDRVYDLIRRMLTAASAPYRSKRIHIGMDEAWDLGRGKLISVRGYTPPSALMAEHLSRVRDIVNGLGLTAMMWSDMHFENAGPGGYYGTDKTFTGEIIRSAPEDIDLVYWDYYHEDETDYERMIRLHRQFKANTVFAGGIWSWSGMAADYEKTYATTVPGLTQCAKHGIREVFATAWGDDGAECPITALLLGLQLFAEMDYTGRAEKEFVLERFRCCTGMDGKMFLRISDLNAPIRFRRRTTDVLNLCKPLLYEDPLIPFFEEDLKGKDPAQAYARLEADFADYCREAGDELKPAFAMYGALAAALTAKCRWREQAADVIRKKDRIAAGRLVGIADENIRALRELKEAWRKLWMAVNKPYGYEVIDIRLGGLIARFETAAYRFGQMARGELDDIPELSSPKLPFLLDADGVYRSVRSWSRIVSASNISD